MKTIQYPYPIATQISISKDRRIRLPKFLGISVPYVVLENKRAEQPWLGLCNVDSLALLRAECESLQLVGDIEVFKMLVEHTDANRGDPDLTLMPPSSLERFDALWVAIDHGRHAIVSYLMDRQKNLQQ